MVSLPKPLLPRSSLTLAKHLSIFGTSSDAGKSTLSFALTYLLHHAGFKTAPFKAQNVSNNSAVCDKGGEIAIPQFFAAEAIGLQTSAQMNPVLLKSGKENKASLILRGYATSEQDVRDYYANLDTLKPIVKEAFEDLAREYELIVAEGAGSPVELNLMDKDLSNIYIATEFNTKIILVADIEKGGVFASIYGVYNLLPEDLKKNVIGVIINKFRGDTSLFDEGRRIIEETFGLKVLGLVPYRALNLGFEDIQSLLNYQQNKPNAHINAAVIRLPHLSNFTDFEALINDPEVLVSFIETLNHLDQFDLLIIPGSKRTITDLKWLKEQGVETALKQYKGIILGICGGYEMMFETLYDEKGVEEEPMTQETGLGLIKETLHFEAEKTLAKGEYTLFGMNIEGYEIHYAKADQFSFQNENVYGTFLHGLLENDNFRDRLFSRISSEYTGYNFKSFKANKIKAYCSFINTHIDLETIIGEIR